MKRQAITLATLLLLSSAAHAADLGWNASPSPIYSPTAASDWSGFYAGVNAGYGWGTVIVSPGAPGAVDNNNSNGWNLGGTVGYNMDMGGFVVGAEGDLQWANIGRTEDVTAGTFKTGVDFYGTVRGRAGMSFGAVMPYVTAGVAAGQGSASLTNGGGVTSTKSSGHIGWTIGAGLEAKATDNISIKAEYLYVDLGSQSYNGLDVGNQDITQRFSVVRAGINYKF